MNGDNGNPIVDKTSNLNQNLNQPFDQTVDRPTFQQVPQPIQNQPIVQPMPSVPNNDNQNPKKKTSIVVGCLIGAAAIIAAIVVLLIILLKPGEKTVTCTTSTTAMGINMKGETNIKAKDGEISGGDVTINIDLKTMQDSYKDYEKDIVDKIIDQYKNECEDHCVFDYNYIEGDSLKCTMQYDEEGVSEIILSYGTEKMSAQEIADKVQKTLEDSNTTCAQH